MRRDGRDDSEARDGRSQPIENAQLGHLDHGGGQFVKGEVGDESS